MKNIIFFIKKVTVSSCLLVIEPVIFEASEIKKILIKDFNGFQKFISNSTDYLGVKINNFFIENGRLEVKYMIEKNKIFIPYPDKKQSFSVFYQPSFEFAFATFSISFNHDGSKNLPIFDLTNNKDLKDEETFLCPSCGYSENRDVNASKNILWKAQTKLGLNLTD